MVFSHRLVIVTGASGVGKTSLLNAGLLSTLDSASEHLYGIYSRCGDDPIDSIGRAISDELHLDQEFERGEESLINFLIRCRDKMLKIPIIVLDQAEELLIRIGEDLRNELILAIRECLITSPGVAHFVISLRDDYLAMFTIFRDKLPNILQNTFFLSEFTHQHAFEAICEPSEKFGVEFNKLLADQILTEIGTDSFSPPQIQIICSSLFENRSGSIIDSDLYTRLGGAKTILTNYFNKELNDLDDEEADAKKVLKSMVTSEGTKEMLSIQEISRRSDMPLEQARNLLYRLRDKSRLIRGIQHEDDVKFELSHEYLTIEIWTWMTEEDLKRRQIEELVARELRSWHRFRHLRLGTDRLTVLEENENLVGLNEEMLALILLSSVKHRLPVERWTSKIDHMDEKNQIYISMILFDFFQTQDINLRREAAEAIAAINPSPIIHALKSNDKSRKKVALEMLGGIGLESAGSEIVPLLKDKDIETRKLACGALGEIGGSVAIKTLIKASRSRQIEIKAEAIGALGRAYDSRACPFIKKALRSKKPLLVEAGIRAVRHSQYPGIVQNLMKDKRIKKNARKALWQAIEMEPKTLGKWILEITNELTDEEQIKLKSFFYKYTGYIENQYLEKSANEECEWKGLELSRRKEQDVKIQAASEKIFNNCSKQFSLKKAASLLLDQDNINMWGACWAFARIADKEEKVHIKIIELVQDSRPRIRAGALQTLSQMNKAPNNLDKILTVFFQDDDPTVRYYACLVAMKHEIIEAVESINQLLSDMGQPAWCWRGVGNLVKDAAVAALDHLNPSSVVWRKPFQKSFNEKHEQKTPKDD
ncbi:HEAT repeat domain-containing protein [Desulfobacterales bacterium HSG16]|nr:HEAT repeat domain-containing protein [Desulfobacterales bacterium HSG16]